MFTPRKARVETYEGKQGEEKLPQSYGASHQTKSGLWVNPLFVFLDEWAYSALSFTSGSSAFFSHLNVTP